MLSTNEANIDKFDFVREKQKKFFKTGVYFLSFVLLGIFVGLVINNIKSKSASINNIGLKLTSECPITVEIKTIRGNSLEPLIESGSQIKVLFGYYNCNEVKRDDLIIYSYAGDENPLIKIVKGLPNDRFGLQKTEGGWHILINGKILKNSENQPYLLDERGYKMLSLYEKDYKGVIPENAYLILGNSAGGTLDSTHFGLVDKSDILGKAEAIK